MKIATLFTSLFLVLSLSGCGQDLVSVPGPQGPKGEQGDKGDPGQDFEAPVSFVGEYYMLYSGFVIITLNHEDEYSVDVQLQSANPDNSICSLDLDSNTIDEHDAKIVYTGNLTMAAGNCKSDSNVALLTVAGTTYQYEVTLSLDEDELLQAELLVFQTTSGVRTLVIDRTLNEE